MLILQGRVGKFNGSSNISGMEEMKRSRNPIKNRAIKNFEFNLEWKT